jgi:hypothetical protein
MAVPQNVAAKLAIALAKSAIIAECFMQPTRVIWVVSLGT